MINEDIKPGQLRKDGSVYFITVDTKDGIVALWLTSSSGPFMYEISEKELNASNFICDLNPAFNKVEEQLYAMEWNSNEV